MSGSVRIEGMRELEAAMKKASADAQIKVGRAVVATGIELRGDVVKRIQRGPASGETYTRGGISHQASAPGEAPATDQGNLASSITFAKAGPMSATVGSDMVYAAALEFGHDYGGGRVIAPRPAWMPAIEKIRPKYVKRVEKALGDSFK